MAQIHCLLWNISEARPENENADNAENMYDFIEAHTGDNLVPDFDAGWTIS